ncbi:plasmid partitioning protein RepB [Sulfitobacter sp. F26204]|uniref:plasmid partitioning protein RepB n=1 Tax=Sulfitobacter sp. F26204 TaxID=2996014 RepID=UPI00225E321F|nr:plasmid partitioning protein RepB [Sulfitobacter sp. F26204]MCX7560564.1 plasmid partitioning protein RepB [Sulfitobacter sp. F26204]
MARNIFNQPPIDDSQVAPPSPAPAPTTKLPGSVGGLRDSLREITANSIRDLHPDQIELDGLRDRLVLEDSSIDELAESIQKHGQQVPIMVRPSAQHDRYRIVYGRRRLAAIRKIGGTVKAIVRTLDDDASLIAQGQENNLRLDPSFIEKSLFIKEMSESGYKPSIIQDALGLTRQGVSNHRVVIEQLPDEIVHMIGPAHGVGRRQWGELAALAKKVALVEIAKETLPSLPADSSSAERFQAVYTACLQRSRPAVKQADQGVKSVVEDRNGRPLATLAVDGKAIAIKVARKNNPEFGQWLEEHAEATILQLFDQWQSEKGPAS